MAATLMQNETKIVVWPVDHFTGSRRTHRNWAAALTLKDDESVRVWCGHENYGHRTAEAAIACGRKAWNRLPK